MVKFEIFKLIYPACHVIVQRFNSFDSQALQNQSKYHIKAFLPNWECFSLVPRQYSKVVLFWASLLIDGTIYYKYAQSPIGKRTCFVVLDLRQCLTYFPSIQISKYIVQPFTTKYFLPSVPLSNLTTKHAPANQLKSLWHSLQNNANYHWMSISVHWTGWGKQLYRSDELQSELRSPEKEL